MSTKKECSVISIPYTHSKGKTPWQEINAYIGGIAARNSLLQHSIGSCVYSDEALYLYLEEIATRIVQPYRCLVHRASIWLHHQANQAGHREIDNPQ